ncbi:hypothetical protein EVAR_34660_1 [Eumeta japonica]|uniref:Uncharacterized protein n=1 Tax=Eumeta variegata TaxID=151549 RepID=A0A4C1VG77_EUMVA|nr:hypothetical protein EVAR_34660_1 [Eumeta japonica]
MYTLRTALRSSQFAGSPGFRRRCISGCVQALGRNRLVALLYCFYRVHYLELFFYIKDLVLDTDFMRQNAVILDYNENKIVFSKKALHAPLVSYMSARTEQKLASAVMTYFEDRGHRKEVIVYRGVCWMTCKKCTMNRGHGWKRKSEERWKSGNKKVSKQASLQPILVQDLLEKIGIDVVGPIRRSMRGNKYMITAIEYASKYVVTKAVPRVTAEAISDFLINEIFCKFGSIYEMLKNTRGRGGARRVLAEPLRLSGGRHLLAAPQAFGTFTNSSL